MPNGIIQVAAIVCLASLVTQFDQPPDSVWQIALAMGLRFVIWIDCAFFT
jgi:hypothetical protein